MLSNVPEIYTKASSYDRLVCNEPWSFVGLEHPGLPLKKISLACLERQAPSFLQGHDIKWDSFLYLVMVMYPFVLLFSLACWAKLNKSRKLFCHGTM